LPKLKEWIDSNDPGAIMIPFSGAFEAKIADMDEDTRKTFCEENKANSTFDKIIAQGYKSLNLMYFFTAGPKEVKAWTIQVCYIFSFLI
jgi:obg-like ATPase 1